MNKSSTSFEVGSIFGWGTQKLAQKKIDPYTRCLLGFVAFMITWAHPNRLVRFFGLGFGAVAFLQIFESMNGGRLTFNKSNKRVFVLKENGENIIELALNEIPNFFIDGIAVEGMNGVFKVSDGIFAGINSNNLVAYSWGVGGLINKVRGAGFKSSKWVDNQMDKRWEALYQKSLTQI